MAKHGAVTGWLLATVALVVTGVAAAQDLEFVRVTAEAANVRKAPAQSAETLRQASSVNRRRVAPIITRSAPTSSAVLMIASAGSSPSTKRTSVSSPTASRWEPSLAST